MRQRLLNGILRRQQLEEKLMREGVKTHKERVEELNKYLSTLSEHHDMPRIGPG
jgi:protein FAM32A